MASTTAEPALAIASKLPVAGRERVDHLADGVALGLGVLGAGDLAERFERRTRTGAMGSGYRRSRRACTLGPWTGS